MRYEIYFGDETRIVLGPPVGYEKFGSTTFTMEDLKNRDTAISFLILAHSSEVSYSFVKIEIRRKDIKEFISILESTLISLFSEIIKKQGRILKKIFSFHKKGSKIFYKAK